MQANVSSLPLSGKFQAVHEFMAMDSSERAYPAKYESSFRLKDSRCVFLRPIRSTDGDLLRDLFHRLSPESVQKRFMTLLRDLPEDMLFRFTHVDYQKYFALVAIVRDEGKDSIVAVGRYGLDPQENATDFAVVVRDDYQGNGLGSYLLRKILEIGRGNGIARFATLIDVENRVMKSILGRLSYKVRFSPRGPVIKAEISF